MGGDVRRAVGDRRDVRGGGGIERGGREGDGVL